MSADSPLRSAIRAAAAASTEERRRIMQQAHAEGAMHMIPDSWVYQALEVYLTDSPPPPTSPNVTMTAGVGSATTTTMTTTLTTDPLTFRNISSDTRKKMAAKGMAMKGGKYPIESESDLKNAIQAYGRAKSSEKAAVRRHIVKRARALGKTALIPDSWKVTSTSNPEQFLSQRLAEFSAQCPDSQLSLAKLRTVYLRGVSEHTQNAVTAVSSQQWAMARVNSFCRLAAGDPTARTSDADLLNQNQAVS